MARTYKEIGEEIAVTGFFSEYLPPCFSFNPEILKEQSGKKCDLIPPLNFTMSKFRGNNSRRIISIPEIGSYIASYAYMESKDIFKELIEFTKTSKHSFSPILNERNTIVRHEQVYDGILNEKEHSTSSSDYIKNIKKKIRLSAGSKKVLKLDISNCFSSVYMHMITAILLGADQAQEEYEKAKKKLNTSSQYKKYDDLDKILRRQNLLRTNGILTGPLFSRIIVEALLTRIDIELESKGINFARYVDDYEVFLYDDEEKIVISEFSEILKKYGFSLNSEKIEIIDFPFYISANFSSIFQKFINSIVEDSSLYPDDNVIALFNSFFELEQNGAKGAIRFLVKNIQKELNMISNELDEKLLLSYLITIMKNDERSLTKVCSVIIEYLDRENRGLLDEFIDIIKRILEQHITYNHDLEVIWLTYLLSKMEAISVDDDLIPKIVYSSNELAQLVLLQFNLVSHEQLEIIKENATSWLLLYELYSRDLIAEDYFIDKLSVDTNLAIYQHLKMKSIHFIVPTD